MTREEAMNLLRNGRYRDWNNYRKQNLDWIPDLSNIDLSEIKLVFSEYSQFNFTKANLCGANLSKMENISHDYREIDKSTNEMYSFTSTKYIELYGAKIDIFTKFPDNFHPTDHGAVLISVSKAQKTESDSPYSVFISYAWANEEIVLAVDQWLRLKGLKTKIDKRDFFAGSKIRDEILRVMQECDVVLIFYSNESKDKPWTTFERELVGDLEMESKKEGQVPPRIIYFVIDETPLPSITEKNRIAVMAKGKRFDLVCEEVYYGILQISKDPKQIDLDKWSDFVF